MRKQYTLFPDESLVWSTPQDPKTFTPDSDTGVVPLEQAQLCDDCMSALRRSGACVCSCTRFPRAA
jgi:hypothetical protein